MKRPRTWRARLKGTTDDRAAVRLLARASVHLGRDSSALLLFERIGNRSMMADDLYLLGVALSRTGNDKGSAEEWTQGLRADPDHPQILYAFGSGDRGKTLVGHDPSGSMFELRMSVYHEKTSQPTWDVTSGHAPRPATDQDFLGMPLTDDGVRRCFACHVTNPQAQLETPGPEAADRAIGCEKCHGPGGNHLLAVAAKFPDLAIARPALVSGASVVKICAQCHSPRGKTVVPDDPSSVRFQGTTLTWSRCYTESKDRLDCATCHDPHRNVSTTASRYEAKCLVCHASNQTEEASNPKERLRRFDLTEAPHAMICPVNPATGCISCHMPTVKGVIPHSPFTDHFIRVHRELSTSETRDKATTGLTSSLSAPGPTVLPSG